MQVSNKLDLKLEGMDDLLKEVEEMGSKGNRVANKALKLAAEPIFNDMVANAPEDTGKGKSQLKIGNISTKKGRKTLPIGLTKDVIGEAYWLRFHEFGTYKMQASPFLSPAYEKNRDQSQKIIIKEIKKGLGLK